jgi:hypothetical protein
MARELLLDQLHAKFGEVPSEVCEKIQAADLTKLRQWVRRVIAGKTISEIIS